MISSLVTIPCSLFSPPCSLWTCPISLQLCRPRLVICSSQLKPSFTLEENINRGGFEDCVTSIPSSAEAKVRKPFLNGGRTTKGTGEGGGSGRWPGERNLKHQTSLVFHKGKVKETLMHPTTTPPCTEDACRTDGIQCICTHRYSETDIRPPTSPPNTHIENAAAEPAKRISTACVSFEANLQSRHLFLPWLAFCAFSCLSLCFCLEILGKETREHKH
ncbi:hypothetical protein MUK42_18528 [Musa troglodytarum]|uniref:Uncharacterized protein n=1 Tax=Musa troglodytarum TaxID=320322 RepID=A0A9E7FYU0_9LILI|nr:hypothetical protein MUK42_18528 [Musa troglodytarum]